MPMTHRRLSDVRSLWERALDAYPRPDAFRLALNSVIQESRNVTFVLKNEKRVIQGFDEWYAGWEARMRADTVMRWAVNARNRVVKQGDLVTNSMARINLIAGWDNPPFHDLEVPPLLGPAAIAARIRVPKLPRPILENAILAVERRWVVNTLPDAEVLTALAHCYSMLRDLVIDAHAKCGIDMAADGVEETHPTGLREDAGPTRMPRAMTLSVDLRTAYLHLKTGEPARYDVQWQKAVKDDALIEEGMRRYRVKRPPGVLPQVKSSADLLRFADFMADMSRKVLQRDRYHIILMHMFARGGEVHQHVLRPRDRADKFVMLHKMAAEVEQRDIVGVVLIGEVWHIRRTVAEIDQAFRDRQIRDIVELPDKSEALQVLAAHEDGSVWRFDTPFERGNRGAIKLGKTKRYDGEYPGLFYPIFKVWEARTGRPTRPLRQHYPVDDEEVE